jgi:hypothetical protein
MDSSSSVMENRSLAESLDLTIFDAKNRKPPRGHRDCFLSNSKEKNYCEVDSLAQISDVLRQTRFVTGRRILMNNAFVDRLIDRRDGRVQQFYTLGLIMTGEGSAEFLDLCAQTRAVAAVDRIALSILSDAFFG